MRQEYPMGLFPEPVEVLERVKLTGTNGSDLMLVTAAVVQAVPGYGVDYAGLEVNALGGDDGIVRDRTGAYDGYDGRYRSALIDGGTGFDVLNYNGADGSIIARLDLTWQALGDGTYVQSNTGYSHITGLGLPIPWENNWIRGIDRVKNVEGVAGTVFDDTLHGDGKANRLWGHDGDDTVIGNGGNDSLWGGNGDDYISGGNGNDRMEGNAGEDDLYGGHGHDSIDGGDGDDVIWGQQGNDTLRGGEGDDSIRGGDGADRIYTGDGADTVTGDAGDDRIHVEGFGGKSIDGGADTDTIFFSQKVVVNLFSGLAWRGNGGVEGTDTIANVENVASGSAADVIVGTDGANYVNSGSGNDAILALGGNDDIYAGRGADTVSGGDGHDTVRGEQGNDSLDGGDGDDTVYGGVGRDTVRGGEGDDEIWGDGVGVPGERDVFLWAAGDIGLDTLMDFQLGLDRLSFGPGFLAAGPAADNLLVFNDNGDSLLAANIAGHGWDFIGRFEGVNAIALGNAIEDGSVFAVQTTGLGGGAPGGFLPGDDPLGIGIGLQIVF
jgi:Ca2+-binding RTX toxin-like protein